MHFFNWNVGYPSSSTSSSYHVMSHDMSFVWYLASMKTSLSNMCLCVFVVLFFTFPDTATASNLVRARRANLTPTLPGISLAPRARQGNRSHFHFTCFLLAPMSRWLCGVWFCFLSLVSNVWAWQLLRRNLDEVHLDVCTLRPAPAEITAMWSTNTLIRVCCSWKLLHYIASNSVSIVWMWGLALDFENKLHLWLATESNAWFCCGNMCSVYVTLLYVRYLQ